jgi:hypothetical protein
MYTKPSTGPVGRRLPVSYTFRLLVAGDYFLTATLRISVKVVRKYELNATQVSQGRFHTSSSAKPALRRDLEARVYLARRHGSRENALLLRISSCPVPSSTCATASQPPYTLGLDPARGGNEEKGKIEIRWLIVSCSFPNPFRPPPYSPPSVLMHSPATST